MHGARDGAKKAREPAGEKEAVSEDTVADVLEFLQDLRGSPLELRRDAPLLREWQQRELLQEITVNCARHRRVVRPEADVLAAGERLLLVAHEHLEMLQEVNLLARRD